MRAYVGVDGGGTNTRALAFAEDGALLGEARSGPSNWQAVGLEAAVQAVLSAVREAVGSREIAGIGACLAGVDLPEDEERLRAPLQAEVGCAVQVENDIVAAVHAADEDPCGVVSSGTGSALALRRGKEVTRLLALNDYTGPTGGAGDIVTLALRSAILAAQGAAPPTALAQEIPRALGLEGHVALARATAERQMPGWQVALIVAPLCAQVARAGDAVARRIFEDQGRELGETAGRFFASHGAPVDLAVTLNGSLFLEGPPAYRTAFFSGLRSALTKADAFSARHPAVHGAALFAARAFDLPDGPLRKALSGRQT